MGQQQVGVATQPKAWYPSDKGERGEGDVASLPCPSGPRQRPQLWLRMGVSPLVFVCF